MKSKLRNYDPPKIPSWFLRDLKTIAPEFYPLWHRSGRWLIVKDVPFFISKRGYIVEFVIHDGKGGYAPLDQRAIEALKKAKQERDRLDNTDKLLRQMDQEEGEKFQKALKLRGEMQTDFSRKVCKFLRSKTFT